LGMDLPVRMDMGFQRAVGMVSVPVRVLGDRPGLRLVLVSLQRLRIRQLPFRFAPVSAPQRFLPAGDRPVHSGGPERPLGAPAARRAVPPGEFPSRGRPSLTVESSARQRSGLRPRGPGSPRVAGLQGCARRAAGGNPENAHRATSTRHPQGASRGAGQPPAFRCRREEKRGAAEDGQRPSGPRQPVRTG
jgi:hypothetical protein